MVITVTDQNFDSEVLQAQEPVLVDFWASWCAPCRRLMPIVEEISDKTAGVKVCKANVGEQKEIAARYGVQSVPTLILFRNGKAADKLVGSVSKHEIVAMMNCN